MQNTFNANMQEVLFLLLLLLLLLFKFDILSVLWSQSGYTVQIVNEGDEPENFFWVGVGGKKDYDKVIIFMGKVGKVGIQTKWPIRLELIPDSLA